MQVVKYGQKTITSTPLNEDNVFNFLLTNPIMPGRVCIHHTILKELTFESDINIGEDTALWLKIALKHPILYSEHIAVNYEIHDENSIDPRSGAALAMLDGLKLLFKRYPDIKTRINKQVYKEYFSRIYTNVAKYYINSGKRMKATKWLRKAIITAPGHEHTKYRLRLLLGCFGLIKLGDHE